jgi:N-acyl-L-homoserine lactone synthetase
LADLFWCAWWIDAGVAALGPCMLNQYFSHVIEGSKIETPYIWECTRFCLPYETPPRVAAALLLAGAELMLLLA